jgi:hypothetical protein
VKPESSQLIATEIVVFVVVSPAASSMRFISMRPVCPVSVLLFCSDETERSTRERWEWRESAALIVDRRRVDRDRKE